jgi:hypothetical protein
MTGYGRQEDRRAAHEAGFTLHLVKPLSSSSTNGTPVHSAVVTAPDVYQEATEACWPGRPVAEIARDTHGGVRKTRRQRLIAGPLPGPLPACGGGRTSLTQRPDLGAGHDLLPSGSRPQRWEIFR